MLWEALAGEHPFWGVPLPQVAAAIEAGAKPLGTARARSPAAARRRRLVGAHDRPVAAAVGGAARGRPADCARLAPARSDERRRGRARRSRPPKAGSRRRCRSSGGSSRQRSRRSPSRSRRRCCRSGRPASCSLLALAAGVAMLRAPRLGLAIALFVPVFPLGNVAQAAAVDLRGGRARAGSPSAGATHGPASLFVAGPLLAPFGGARAAPARRAAGPRAGAARRSRRSPASSPRPRSRACVAQPLPLTGSDRPQPRRRRLDARHATWSTRSPSSCRRTPALVAVALVLAARGRAAAGRPPARARRGSPCSASCQLRPRRSSLAPALSGAARSCSAPARCAPFSRALACRAAATLSRGGGHLPQ